MDRYICANLVTQKVEGQDTRRIIPSQTALCFAGNGICTQAAAMGSTRYIMFLASSLHPRYQMFPKAIRVLGESDA